jgi:hypothetical protein
VEEAMIQGCVKVLLLGQSAKGSSYLLRRLEQRGCHCSFATSAEEALTLFERHAFHLILSTSPLHQANPLIDAVGESNCRVFCCYPVEDGYWWLPLERHGQKGPGAPAFRPSEFLSLLDRLVTEIKLEDVAAKEPQEVQP